MTNREKAIAILDECDSWGSPTWDERKGELVHDEHCIGAVLSALSQSESDALERAVTVAREELERVGLYRQIGDILCAKIRALKLPAPQGGADGR